MAKFQVVKLFCLAACTNGLIYKNTNKTKMFRNTIRANNKMHVILNFYFPQVALPIATKCHVQVFSGTLFTNSTTNLAVKHYFYQLILSLALQCLWFSSSEDPNSWNHHLTFHYSKLSYVLSCFWRLKKFFESSRCTLQYNNL